jgi:hypothetical protein
MRHAGAERGGGLGLHVDSQLCDTHIVPCEGDRQEQEEEASGGSRGSKTGGRSLVIMATSTSDFWWEVLKTPS